MLKNHFERVSLVPYLVAILFCFFELRISIPSFALPVEEEEIAQEIFHSIMSPYCPGRLLTDCPSTQAHELKEKIRTDIEQGKSKDAIEEDLVALFGESVWAAPRASGFGIAAWVTPFLFLLGGAVLIIGWFAIRRRRSDLPPVVTQPLSPEMQRKIEQEMNN